MTGFKLSEADKVEARQLQGWPDGVSPISANVQPPKPQAAVGVGTAQTAATPQTPENGPVGPDAGAENGNSTPDMAQVAINAMIASNCHATAEQQQAIRAAMSAIGATGGGRDLSSALAEMEPEAEHKPDTFNFNKDGSIRRIPNEDLKQRSNLSTRRIIYGPFARGEVCGISAPADVGKTTIISGMLLAACYGKPWMGFKPYSDAGYNTLFLTYEDVPTEINNKAEATLIKMFESEGKPVDETLWDKRFHILDGRVVAKDLFQVNPADQSLHPGPGYHKLSKYIEAHNIDIVAIDPIIFISAYCGYDENDNSKGHRETELLKNLAQEHECAMVAVSHASKNGDQKTPRGASARFAAYRTSAAIYRPDMNECQWMGIDWADRKKFTILEIEKGNILPPEQKGKLYFEFGGVTLEAKDPEFSTTGASYAKPWQRKHVAELMTPDQRSKLLWRLEQGIHEGNRREDEQPHQLYTCATGGNAKYKVVDLIMEIVPDITGAQAQTILDDLMRPDRFTGEQYLCEGKFLNRNSESRKCVLPVRLFPEDALQQVETNKGVKSVKCFDDEGNLRDVPVLGDFTPKDVRDAYTAKNDWNRPALGEGQ